MRLSHALPPPFSSLLARERPYYFAMTRLVKAGVLCAVLLVARATFAAGLSGSYIAEITPGPTAEKQYARVTLNTVGTTISGTWGDRAITGSLKGTRLEISLSDASGAAGTLIGNVNGSSASGSGTLRPAARTGGGVGATAQPTSITWTLTPYTPPTAPKVYDYEPKSFYTTYSAEWAPVLRIYPGDTVRTRTVDNDRDAAATRYGVGGNPSTGPRSPG